jgi:hypothetical protein
MVRYAILRPGDVLEVRAGQIQHNALLYRTNQGYASPGYVGWVPNGGVLQDVPLEVGGTVAFAINGTAGMIANGCPSMVRVQWDNALAIDTLAADTPNVLVGGSMKMLQTERAKAAVAVSGSMQQAMETLNAQWYNALTNGLHLDPSTFQLMQGNSVIGSLSETLWSIFDAVPPLSVNNYYNPSQFNSFSANYGSIITNLNQPGSNNFQNDMGDYYSDWFNFLSQQKSLPDGGLTQLFQSWSQMNMPAGQAMQCYTDLANIYQGSVFTAITMWLNAGGSGGSPKAYNITVEQVSTKIVQAPSGSVTMNSQTESSDVSHSWAKGEVGGWYDLFAGEAGGSYDELSMDLISAGLKITVQFTHVLTMTAAPLNQTSKDPILSKYKPWYSSATLNLAYQNKNNGVWKNNPPTWDSMFGLNGSLLRVCSALIIVDGVDITATSAASFNASQQKQFQAQAKVGFWPFFEASASGGWSNNFSFDDQGRLTYTASSPVGNPVILGAIVSPIAAVTML